MRHFGANIEMNYVVDAACPDLYINQRSRIGQLDLCAFFAKNEPFQQIRR